MTTQHKLQAHPDFVRARVSEEKKRQLSSLAQKKGISEASLLRQAVYRLLKDPDPTETAVAPRQQPAPRKNRLTIPIDPAVRRALQERAALRSLTAGSYASRLIQAHLSRSPRLPAKEFAAIERTVLELNAIGRDLNKLVKDINGGAAWADPAGNTLKQVLATFETLATQLTEFARTNRKSWDVNDPD